MKKNLPKPFRITTQYLFSTIILFVLVTGIYVYLFHTIKKLGEHSATLFAEVTALEVQESEIGQLRKNVQATDENLKQLTLHFINTGDIVPFLETVEGYGRTLHVVTKFDSVVVEKSPNRVTLSLSANGTFTDVYRFIALLESSPYELTFTNVNLQSTDGGTQDKKLATGIWNAHITLSVLSVIPAE
jgi:hypothetical protein